MAQWDIEEIEEIKVQLVMQDLKDQLAQEERPEMLDKMVNQDQLDQLAPED